MFKTITKDSNRKRIMIYYVLALIFFLIGIFFNSTRWYFVSTAFLLLALVRKFFLMKRLKD